MISLPTDGFPPILAAVSAGPFIKWTLMRARSPMTGISTATLKSAPSIRQSPARTLSQPILVTGVSVNIRQGLYLDVGYKFSYLGSASMDYDYSHDAVDAGAVKSSSIELDDIFTHEFKIGLRYDLY